MVMEGYFHEQVCPNIDNNIKIDQIHVQLSRGIIFAETQNTRSIPSPRACKVNNFHMILDYW